MQFEVRKVAGSSLPVFILGLSVLLTGAAVAQQYQVLHNFCRGKDGCEPNGGLVFDSAGNIYGTTSIGGTSTSYTFGCGTVFELSPKKGGGWSERLLHSFANNGTDGYNPLAGVIIDSAGNLYGTTQLGGTAGEGTVFELSPNAKAGWTERVLHSFNEDVGEDGRCPEAGLTIDPSGNLYGTTYFGGRSQGTVFELTPTTGGGWLEAILYIFDLSPVGIYPQSNLILDASGELIGTTVYGGDYDECSRNNAGFYCGTVFKLTPTGAGEWSESSLYSFGSSADGYYPDAGLVFDRAGNLYGTTPYGGVYTDCQYPQLGDGCGTLFKLSPSNQGGWTETVVQNFGSTEADGTLPSGGLTIDKSGNLYGSTQSTGPNYAGGYGTVFEFSPKAGGGWSRRILHNFGAGKVGARPSGNLSLDAAGNLYGAAGVGFEITP